MADRGDKAGKMVSMKSGLEGRNNLGDLWILVDFAIVSMKSGLEGRNNNAGTAGGKKLSEVSMKSGLEGRNNWTYPQLPHWT